MSATYIPAGHGAVAPFLIVSDAKGLIDFIARAFGGLERSRSETPEGVVRHAIITIDSSIVMVGSRPRTFENSIHLYVPNVDETYRKCLDLGAESVSEPTSFSYGDRSAGVRDPFGNTWWIGTHAGPSS